MSKKENILEKKIARWFAKSDRVVIAGIGNPIRTDDYVGVEIVRNLLGNVSNRVLLIECETVPENFLQEIVEFKPSHVLLIDAAIIGIKPGEVRLINPKQIVDFPAFTTHVLPLRIFCEYITQESSAKIGLLLIQPQKVEFGEGLTPEVSVTAKKVAKILLKFLESNV